MISASSAAPPTPRLLRLQPSMHSRATRKRAARKPFGIQASCTAAGARTCMWDAWHVCCTQSWCCAPGSPEATIYVPVRSVAEMLNGDTCLAYPRVRDELVEAIISDTWDVLSVHQTVHVVIESLDASDASNKDALRMAQAGFSNTFRREAQLLNQQLRRTCHEGILSVLISLIVIAVALAVLVPLLNANSKGTLPWWDLIVYGFLIIMVWVAVWHPFELLVYGRYVPRIRANVCACLGDATLTVAHLAPHGPTRDYLVWDAV